MEDFNGILLKAVEKWDEIDKTSYFFYSIQNF